MSRAPLKVCAKGHLMTPANTSITHRGNGRIFRLCRACRNVRQSEYRRVRRAQLAAEREARRAEVDISPTKVRWQRRCWVDDDGYAYAEVEAIEYERANEETFRLAARRALTRHLKDLGLQQPTSKGWWEQFGEPRLDWATDLPMTHTIRTVEPVVAVEVERAA